MKGKTLIVKFVLFSRRCQIIRGVACYGASGRKWLSYCTEAALCHHM